MGKKTESVSDVTDTKTETKPDASPEVATTLPSDANLHVLAYFVEHNDGANYHALQAQKAIEALGVKAVIVKGGFTNEAGEAISRLVVELPGLISMVIA